MISLPTLTRRSQETPAQGLLVAARSLDAFPDHRHGAAMSTTLPLDFPLLQAEAQRLTVEFLGLDPTGHEAARAGSTAAPAVRAFADLLRRLDRPESRDRWAWLMAAKLGLPEGLTAPSFRYNTYAGGWLFVSGGREFWFVSSLGAGDRRVPDLPLDPTQGVEAFRLALCAALGVAP